MARVLDYIALWRVWLFLTLGSAIIQTGFRVLIDLSQIELGFWGEFTLVGGVGVFCGLVHVPFSKNLRRGNFPFVLLYPRHWWKLEGDRFDPDPLYGVSMARPREMIRKVDQWAKRHGHRYAVYCDDKKGVYWIGFTRVETLVLAKLSI